MRFILFVCLLLLTACSSNLRKGDNMMDAEQYDQAVMYYERALQEDPGDEDIAVKLYEARTRMVAANLIKVRLQRQGKQPKAAAIQLNQSLKHFKQWNIIADSGVKATIEEEVREAGIWLNQTLKRLGQQQNYNRYFYYLAQFDEIIATGLAKQAEAEFSQPMKLLGQNHCNQLKRQLTQQSHFFYQYWQRYCAVFDVQQHYQLAPDSSRYSRLNISYRRVGVAAGAQINPATIAENIRSELQNNIWFSNQGAQSMSLMLRGQINYSVSSQKKAFKRVYKSHKETLEVIRDPKNPKKVIRRLVHKQPIEKTATFYGKEITERSSHTLQLTGKVNGLPLSETEAVTNRVSRTQSHNTYFKSEGIRPLAANYFDQQGWQSQMGKGLIQKAKKRLNSLWTDAYCTSQTESRKATKNEYPARCAQLEPAHASVIAWSKKLFNLNYNELEIMLSGG